MKSVYVIGATKRKIMRQREKKEMNLRMTPGLGNNKKKVSKIKSFHRRIFYNLNGSSVKVGYYAPLCHPLPYYKLNKLAPRFSSAVLLDLYDLDENQENIERKNENEHEKEKKTLPQINKDREIKEIPVPIIEIENTKEYRDLPPKPNYTKFYEKFSSRTIKARQLEKKNNSVPEQNESNLNRRPTHNILDDLTNPFNEHENTETKHKNDEEPPNFFQAEKRIHRISFRIPDGRNETYHSESVTSKTCAYLANAAHEFLSKEIRIYVDLIENRKLKLINERSSKYIDLIKDFL